MTETTPPLSPEERKKILINGIVQRNRQAMIDWQTAHPRDNRLDLPLDAIRYFIPPQLLEQSAHPELVQLKIAQHIPDYLNFLVFETRKSPLSDRNGLKTGSGFVDPMHVEFKDEIKEGFLTLNDYIYMDAGLIRASTKELHVSSFLQHPELRGSSVATAFYEMLRTFALDNGFRYITGQNAEDNIDYFKNKLGRKLLTQVSPHLKQQILRNHGNIIDDEHYFTVDILHPVDL